MSEKKITDSDYLYLSAVLRAREPAMLTRDKLERMVSAGSMSEAAKLLQEGGWPDMSGENARGVDKKLTQRRAEIYAEMERSVPEREIVDIFRLKYDYHNAKALIKGEGAGVDVAHILSDAGRVPPKTLEEAFREDDYRDIPPALAAAMGEAKTLLARTGNPQAADFVLDKAYYAEMGRLAGEVKGPFASQYVRTLIDGANLRTVVRCVRMGKDPDFMRQALIPGGDVSLEEAVRGSITPEELMSLYGDTPYQEAAALGGAVLEGGAMTAFERECDNAVNRFLEAARKVSFGSEVVIGYLAAEENSTTTVRMVLTGLLSGIDPERLKERLRDTYV